MKLSDEEIEGVVNNNGCYHLDYIKEAIRQLKEERDRYREALETIVDGDESKIWEEFPDVTYDEAVMLFAKQALEKDDGSNI
jgi:aspartyl/asparaginyl-tRNA synthetase